MSREAQEQYLGSSELHLTLHDFFVRGRVFVSVPLWCNTAWSVATQLQFHSLLPTSTSAMEDASYVFDGLPLQH